MSSSNKKRKQSAVLSDKGARRGSLLHFTLSPWRPRRNQSPCRCASSSSALLQGLSQTPFFLDSTKARAPTALRLNFRLRPILMTRINPSAAAQVAEKIFFYILALKFGLTSAEDDHWDHEHSEEPMLTGSELAGIVCGVLAGAIILTIVSLCLLRHFDPRAWGRLVNCMRSMSSCNLSGPEHPDQPVKSRDLEDPSFIEVKQPEKMKDKTSLDLSNKEKKEQSQPLKSDDEGQDQVDQKKKEAENAV